MNFADLENLSDLNASPNAKPVETYPCMKCGGTGVYRFGYMNPQSGKCHACNGKGHFVTSEADRRKAKASRQASKAKKAAAGAQAFIAKHEELSNWIAENRSWNGFAASLNQQLNERGSLTDNQIAAITKTMHKCMATQARKDEERAEADKNRTVLDLTKLGEVFGNAKEAGNKKPILRLGDLKINIAPPHGRNAGHLYVKDHGEYAGKISPEGKWYPMRSARPEINEELIAFAADPMGAAIRHGRVTGSCACCGRELTRKESIERGVGAICAEKWGL